MADISNSRLFQLDSDLQHLHDARIVIVKTEWNAVIVDALHEGCLKILTLAGLEQIDELVVPGAFEIPFGIRNHWEKNKYRERPDAYIALGCVIRGGTPHFDYVCRSVTDGILQLNLMLPIPSIFGVLTVDSMEQAEARTGGAHGNKGEEAAITAMKMIAFSRRD
jgi:6,7-dimethyl-8-ribityllumazine synthase